MPSVNNSEGSSFAYSVLEFYSGIGGMHYAFQDAFPGNYTLKSFDINNIANQVYQHNFSSHYVCPKILDSIKASDIDAYRANVFLMSPPCQPYTRIGKQLDTADPRAKSFLHLINLFSELTIPPDYILVENVKGFENSQTRTVLVDQLRKLNYTFQEFLLSPLQFGLPNSRTRYYLLAKRSPFKFQSEPSGTVISYIPGDPLTMNWERKNKVLDGKFTPFKDNNEIETAEEEFDVAPISSFLEALTSESLSTFLLTDKVLSKHRNVLDIVNANSHRSCCFTKGYFRYAEGTGSVLEIPNEDEGIQQLRYFTPREVSRLMGFPVSFSFPTSILLKQQYQLLGNSLNVKVVSKLISYLLSSNNEADDTTRDIKRRKHLRETSCN